MRAFFCVGLLAAASGFMQQQQIQQCITKKPSTWSRYALSEEDEVVVIGSGFGGLSAGALLAHYGKKVTLVESHDRVGGCAHAFERQGYTLDSGPSLWAGMSVPSTNPLRQVLDAVGATDKIDWVTYDGWGCHDCKTGKRWRMTVGPDDFESSVVPKNEVGAWRRLLDSIDPVVDASMACPPMALRADAVGFIRTAFLPYLLGAVASASIKCSRFVPDLLTGPASLLFELDGTKDDHGHEVVDTFVKRWIDYLSFAISALPSEGTVGAATAYTLGDLYHSEAFLDYPLGGSGAVAEALRDAIDDVPGCQVCTRAHVEEILVGEEGAVGVRLRNGTEIRAKHVISNADLWTTAKLVKDESCATWRQKQLEDTRVTPSFVHLWVGFDGAGIPEDLDCHHSVFNDGFFDAEIDAPKNMHIISIPSLFDASMAPPGKHVAHVYAAANEPFDEWENLTGEEYREKKNQAAEPLWTALEEIIPNVRDRAECVIVGSPLTHARFNRRYRGTYGPSFGAFADGKSPLKNLFLVGDSNFPGIGVPAAAASGILVANSLVSVKQHQALLRKMEAKGSLCAGKAWWEEAAAKRPPAAKGGRISMQYDK